ncbi:MAG: sialate O-acetylesterase [Bacteroidia bacterium]
MVRTIFLFAWLLTISEFVFTQASPQHFQHVYEDQTQSFAETGEKIIQTSPKDFVIAGGWGAEGFMMKVNNCGDTLWRKNYQFGAKTLITDLVEVDSGTLVAVGYCQECNGADLKPKTVLLRANPNGDVINSVILGDSGAISHGNAIVTLPDGGFLITGSSSGLTGCFRSSGDIYVKRLDSNLSVIWSQSYNQGVYDYAEDICLLNDGGFAVSGASFGGGKPLQNAVWKMDSIGVLEWDTAFATYIRTCNFHVDNGITTLPNGNLLVTGSVQTDSINETDLFIGELDVQTGQTLKYQTFGTGGSGASSNIDRGFDVHVLSDSTIMVAGTRGGWANFNSAWILVLDTSFTEQKSFYFPFSGYSAEANSVVPIEGDSLQFAFCGMRNYLGVGTDAIFGNRMLFSQHIVLQEMPVNRQLYPRSLLNDSAIIIIKGEAQDSLAIYDEVRLRVYKNDTILIQNLSKTLSYTANVAPFIFSVSIPAEPANHTFELLGIVNGCEFILYRAEEVIAGDAFIIQGQSNAVTLNNDQADSINQSPFIRVYGSASQTGFDSQWFIAQGDGDNFSDGLAGQWGLKLARDLLDTFQIPIAILNGGRSGQPVSYFHPDSGNYTRLLLRSQNAGLTDAIRGIFWFQGETDGWLMGPWEAPDIDRYKDRFHLVDSAWASDYSHVEKTYSCKPGLIVLPGGELM